MKNIIKELLSPLFTKVWNNPKSRLRAACDEMPRNKRMACVAILLTAFILTAFFVFGHACYKIGVGHAKKSLEIEHIRNLELLTATEAYEYAR